MNGVEQKILTVRSDMEQYENTREGIYRAIVLDLERFYLIGDIWQ